jgi:hypothetical protein
MFFRQRKTGIRIIRIYDGVRLNDEIISAPPKQTNQTLEDMKANPKRYAYNMKLKDQLLNSPKIKISTLSEPEYLEEYDIDVIAEIEYTYKTVVTPHKTNPVIAFLVILTIWSIFGAIAFFFLLEKKAEQTQIDSRCYYYTQEGIPQSITIEGEKYRLNPDGTLHDIDRVFFNPWHRQVLEEGNCIKVDTKKGN